MKKLTLLTYTLLLLYSSTLTPIFAQTPGASPSGSIRDSVKKQVAEELSQIKQSVAKKGFVGTISAKSDGNLTITNLNNQPRTATITADATIKLSGGKDGTPADLKIGDFVIAMGDVDSANLMTIKRLLVTSVPASDKRLSLWGTVTKVTTSTLTLESLDKKTYVVKLQSASKYTGTTKTPDIKVDSKISVIGTTTSDFALTAKYIHLFQ